VKQKLSLHTDAIKDFTKAIELKPDYSIYYYYRANSKNSMENAPGGCEDLKKAKELGFKGLNRDIKIFCE
jgi:tetratricopeptide (TPR) repeat protein